MGNREELDHLTAQWLECPVPVAAEAPDRAFAAFKHALAELGIPDHPGASAPLRHATAWRLAEVVTFRACEILGLPPEAVLGCRQQPGRRHRYSVQFPERPWCALWPRGGR